MLGIILLVLLISGVVVSAVVLGRVPADSDTEADKQSYYRNSSAS